MSYIERYWRDAKPEDAIKDPPMVARFRQDAESGWRFGADQKLTGVDRDDGGVAIRWFCNKTSISFGLCQVYDAPDPGEGWRLIDPDKDNYNQDGIEFWNKDKNTWVDRWACKGRAFLTDTFYRIRIAPTVTYVPFTWEDREQLRGRIIVVTWENGAMQEFIAQHFTKTTDGRFEVAKVDADRLVKVGKFLDTGKPVGKEVTQ